MRKRIVSVICTIMLVMGLTIIVESTAMASESEPILNGSKLTHDTESTGTSMGITRGQDYQTGYSKIVRLGPGVIYAGGTTIADHIVDSVKIAVIVERALNAEDEWHYVDSWKKENKDAELVSANKRLEVEGGWYYRVRSLHSAGKDSSSSYTNGIFIEKP